MQNLHNIKLLFNTEFAEDIAQKVISDNFTKVVQGLMLIHGQKDATDYLFWIKIF
jgi:hypothetical protein